MWPWLKLQRLTTRNPDLSQLAVAIAAMEAALAASPSRVLWTNRVPTGLAILADQDQLLRMIVNIGRNAVQALDAQANAAVTLTAFPDDHRATVIDIADNGPGIPEKMRDHLFQPFAGQGRAGGNGLGLAIARELARAHGGDVTLVKSDASGTVFRITLPSGTNGEETET